MADLTTFSENNSADNAARRLSAYVERIIRLAARMSPERTPTISDLEELAATTQDAVAVLRSVEEVTRRRERIEALLSRLPDFSTPRGLDLTRVNNADLEQLQTFVDSLEEARMRLETSKAQLRDATDRHAFGEVQRLAAEAQNASEAEARARQQVSEWLSSREVGVHEAPPAAGEGGANSPAPSPEPAPPGTPPAPLFEAGEGIGQEVEHPGVGTGGAIPPAEGKGPEKAGDLTPPPPPQVSDLTPGMPPGAAVGGVEEARAQEASPPEPPESGAIRRALVQAIRHERLGLAVALTEVAAPGEVPGLLGAALPLAAMAMVADISGEIDDRAREATERALEALQEAPEGEETQLALVLLVPATATLAVLAPGSGQTSLLAAMVGDSGDHARQFAGLPALRELAVKIYQSAHVAGLALNPGSDVMQALLTEEQWRQQLSEASKEISAWHSQELARQIRFAAATDVWHNLLRPGGLFHASLQAAAQGATSRVEEVRKFIAGLDVKKAIRATERKVRGASTSRRSPIDGPAYRELERGAEEALHRLQSWVSLVDRAPSRAGSPRGQPIAEVRTQLLERVRAVMEELSRLEDLLAAGAPCGMAALQRLLTVLDGGSPQRVAPSLDALLGRDLAGVVGVRFGAGWSRQQPLPEAARAELIALAEAPDLPPLLESARRRIVAGDFVGAELVIDLAGDSEDRPKLLRELRTAVDRQRIDLVHLLEAKRTLVEEAERTGRLETGPAQELTERLSRARDQVLAAAPTTAAEIFAEAQQELHLAEEKLRERHKLARERINRRLNLLRQIREPERERVEDLLKSGQFALAEDLVERLEAGESLEAPSPIPVGDAFSAFFPAGAERLASWLRGRRTAMRDIADGTLTVPPDLLASGMEITPDLRGLAEAWADCVRENSRNGLQDALIRLFSAFGFTDPELPGFATPAKKVTEATLQLRVRPLRERETAVLPQFGSEADGAYRLLCLWQKRDAEDITQALAALPSSSAPTIVLFFNPLDQEQRTRLAALARADRLRTAIVIDETLALHLGLLPRGRLMALFACTLPFTDSRPWADTGTPPPEMFFGRARELRAVAASSGEFTHLLYGGRQLGKTAMLRQVERSAAADRDTLARYISIAEIGLQQPPSELWPRLVEELTRAGVPVQRAGSAQQAVRTAVRDWLSIRPGRRILLLLDEADAFFEKDRQTSFAVTAALRDLTVETERRFKPVFAGLRNVQKLARDPNSPIAHLGMPLVVGPLLRGEERQQAESLVRWPFTALGYRLDEAVVSRILAFANYYPSLIQVVCQRLLRSLRQQSSGSGPPWAVRMEDVERVLETAELRHAAFERFRITLELDPRYNLLTLLVANFSIDEPELLASGIDKATLRSLAADAWPAGFPPSFPDDAFEALLDEMVGLGLLRSVGGAHYALRSANLAHLIGSPGEIRRQIDGFGTRPAPATSDPLEMRRMIGGRPGLLTARQEGHLLTPGGGVAILAGTKLAAIEGWTEAVEAAVRFARERHGLKVAARKLGSPHDLARFRSTLDERLTGDVALHLVPPSAPWDTEWVQEALKRVRAAQRGGAPLRVLFIADAARAWHWVGDPGRRSVLDEGDAALRVVELTAGPWSADDVNLWADGSALGLPGTMIMRATGGWDRLVRRLQQLKVGERTSPADDLAQRLMAPGPDGDDPLDDVLSLADVLPVLQALAECEDGRIENEIVAASSVADFLGQDEGIVERVLTWAELVGLVGCGPHGLALDRLVKLGIARKVVAGAA